MICDVTGVIPKEVEILMDQEVVVEVEDQPSIKEISRAIQGLFHWGGQTVTVDSVVATQASITEIVKEWEVQREKQKELEQEQWKLRENQQECQQQMIEILEKVSEQAKKVENIHSGSMPALDREYYTPPVSQVKINQVSKLSAPPNLPIILGQEPVPSMEGSIDQWLFQVEGALVTHTEELVRSAVIVSVRGAVHELLDFIGYGEEMSNILKHIKERFWQGPSKAKLQKEFFLMEQRKTESINQFVGQVEQSFKRLRALYPGRYDCGQLKEWVIQGMHPHLRDLMRFLYMKEKVGYEEFLATVYEAETEGTEGKVLNVKAKVMMVEKVVNKNVSTDLQDIKQQMESLAMIMKNTTVEM